MRSACFVVAASLLILPACRPEASICPRYRTESGIFLDYRVGGLRGNVTGTVCVEQFCQPLAEWAKIGRVVPGVILLNTPHARRSVLLRVQLGSTAPSRSVRASLNVSLRSDLTAGCAPTGYTAAVALVPGALVSEPVDPAWR